MVGDMGRKRKAVFAALHQFGEWDITDEALVSFVDQTLQDFDDDRLDDAKTTAIAALTHRMWSLGAARERGTDVVRVGTSKAGVDGWLLERTYVDVVTDDRPFLIDSLAAAIAERGMFIEFLAHPIVTVHRDADGARDPKGEPVREALIHIEMDPVLHDDVEAEIEREVLEVLADVRVSVADWESMMGRMSERIASFEAMDGSAHDETVAFLKWLRDGNFAFLGARRFEYDPKADEPYRADHSQGLGLLRDADRRVLRRSDGTTNFTPAIRAFMEGDDDFLVAKANFRSTVHRRVHMDYVGVKRLDENGAVVGEERFVGLFTSEAYVSETADVPLVRRKVARILERTNFSRDSHNYKALRNILETYPRDELFQAGEDEIEASALGMLRLRTRPRPKAFIRKDPFDRFVSVIVFVPRERFNSLLRERIGDYLQNKFGGRLSAYYPTYGDQPLARIHYIIGGLPAETPAYDIAEIDEAVARMARGWDDDFADALRDGRSRGEAVRLFEKYARGFGPGYRDSYGGAIAVRDVAMLETCPARRSVAVRAYTRSDGGLGVKLYRRDDPVPLSDVLPIFENIGLRVLEEEGSEIETEDGVFWIHDFYMRGVGIDVDLSREALERLESAVIAVWDGAAENDRFNALVTAAGMTWREAIFMRAFCRFQQQAGAQYTPTYMARALARHADAARALLSLFEARFTPDGFEDDDARDKAAADARDAFTEALEQVERLDEDRILRRILEFIDGTVRTNAYQKGPQGDAKDTLSFKLDSSKIEALPKPRPYREIFVYSPRVEGVHLRFGPVARGGLRWSDRREDYRAEVLDLAKAQRVKNAVIVPAGAKGGFYPKKPPAGGDREAVFEAGKKAYREFIGALLDVTDNLDGETIAPPPQVRRLDGDDPYLVVAADKGTASFSDTANDVSTSRGFWLGDAFASGGSQGYDHKVMGITARGAWEAVKRHFREIGKDIQNEPFSVIGVGDMSGDVFGNGMLLSRRIRLIAAFDHRDIFIDPDPDPDTSWKERKRLFDLGRSTWRDYDESLLSKGGGILSRSSKSVRLTAEMRKAIALDEKEATPFDVIRAILKMKADLLWFGGIGTYVKGDRERNVDVGDRANDPIRVDASDLRVKVIGEGANLGITQAGRVGFARRGGYVNTDAIDNAAGVDSSDHEVNIKILLRRAIEENVLPEEERNDLLAAMTEDVARLVLVHNYDQTGGLSLIAAHGAEDLPAHRRLIRILEQEGRVDRALDGLPSDEILDERVADGLGLFRPELAVLLANVKIRMKEAILAGDLPDDAYLDDELRRYFPPQLHERCEGLMRGHRLNREILATRLSNSLVDLGGLTLCDELMAATGVTLNQAATAVFVAREVFDIPDLVDRIDELDLKVATETQHALRAELVEIMRRHALWLLAKGRLEDGVSAGELITRYRPAVGHVIDQIDELLTKVERRRFDARIAQWVRDDAPKSLAKDVAALRLAASGPILAETADAGGYEVADLASVFSAVGAAIGLDRARSMARAIATQLEDSYEEYAVRRLVDELTMHQAQVAAQILGSQKDLGPDTCITAELWVRSKPQQLEPLKRTFDVLLGEGDLTVAKLTLAEGRLAEAVRRIS